MNKEKDKSAIDCIYEILEKIDKIENQIKNIDTNVKLLNNKVSKLMNQNSSQKNIAPIQSELPSAQPVIFQPSEYIKIFSRIRNKRKVPVSGINIKIYDSKGNVVKERKTDNHGYWEARIPPGEYGVEYDPSSVNSRLKVANFNIKVKSGIKEMDLSSINH